MEIYWLGVVRHLFAADKFIAIAILLMMTCALGVACGGEMLNLQLLRLVMSSLQEIMA